MELQPHQQRVVTEKDELDEKIEKLSKFFRHQNFPHLAEAEKNRLEEQYRHMQAYSLVLGARIEAFKIAHA